MTDQAGRPTRREFLRHFLALAGTARIVAGVPGALLAACTGRAMISGTAPADRGRFPHGVASGDPGPRSVMLWTRALPADAQHETQVELVVSEREDLAEPVVATRIRTGPDADHTVRALVEGLSPDTVYWYRFRTPDGAHSRLGRTWTAPPPGAEVPVRFAAVSCQHRQLGHMAAWRHMIAEDRERPADERIRFVLHLGDFIYEEVWYPGDRDGDRFLERPIRDTVRFPDGAQNDFLRYPATLADYRALYKAYLDDEDLQAARARWPFVCTWDDHEFSNNAWQSWQYYEHPGEPAQQRKVAANQAWFEYIPSQLGSLEGIGGEPVAHDFEPREVEDADGGEIGDDWVWDQPDNLAALSSLTIYRSLAFGSVLDLVLTDTRSYRSPPFPEDLVPRVTGSKHYNYVPAETIAAFDGGREYAGGNPPEVLPASDPPAPNPRRDRPPGTYLGHAQKAWFKDTLKASRARWCAWGNATGLLPREVDFQHLPDSMREGWRSDGPGLYSVDDWDGWPTERQELLDFLGDEGIHHVVSMAGDRHVFAAGHLYASDGRHALVEVAAPALTTPCPGEVYQYLAPRRPDLAPLFWQADRGVPAFNQTIARGVRRTLADAGHEVSAEDWAQATRHWRYYDAFHQGYTLVRCDAGTMRAELVAFPRPQGEPPAGIPRPVYRAHLRTARTAGQPGALEIEGFEGTPPYPWEVGMGSE